MTSELIFASGFRSRLRYWAKMNLMGTETTSHFPLRVPQSLPREGNSQRPRGRKSRGKGRRKSNRERKRYERCQIKIRLGYMEDLHVEILQKLKLEEERRVKEEEKRRKEADREEKRRLKEAEIKAKEEKKREEEQEKARKDRVSNIPCLPHLTSMN